MQNTSAVHVSGSIRTPSPASSHSLYFMSTIRILPDQVANRIAAGEVIERPIAVVKELVDNSIDAGADRIKVQFKQGGKSYVLVEDNGKGMTPDDALLSLERHATSKIRSSDDLFNIQTLGFRGEAIPSIASVSRFLMRTRPVDQLEGTEVLVNGGKLIHRKEVGMPPGTRTEVTHLFSSIPARRKFLKTDNTEASHIIQWVRLIAVAHPGIAFRLLSNERTLISVPAQESQLDRILSLWGRELESQLKPLEFEANGIHATGFIGKAGVSRPSRQDIVTIVNGRPVESRTLGFAFTEAFHTHIPRGRYPVVFMQFKVDPSMIDVNIHPSKKEIKFKNESTVRTLIIQQVWAVLRHQSVTLKPEADANIAHNAGAGAVTGISGIPLPATSTHTSPSPATAARFISHPHPSPVATAAASAPPMRVASSPQPRVSGAPVVSAMPSGTPVPTKASNPGNPGCPTPSSTPSAAPLSIAAIEKEWRYIGDYHRSYSIFERSGGLSLVHNSRALRRIGYEKVLAELHTNPSHLQHDMVPATLELEVHTSARLKKWIPLLAKSGLIVEEFGRNFFRLEAVPSVMDATEGLQLIEKWLHLDTDVQLDLDTVKTEVALVCCRKYRHQLELPLRKEVAIDVLCQLLACTQPMVDPEGAPVIQHIPHRLFENLRSLEEIS